MAEPTFVDSFNFYSDPCFLPDDLPIPTDFGDFNLDVDVDFSIDEFLRSPEHSGNGSCDDGSPHSMEPARVESPDSGGSSHESAVTSPDVKQEDESKLDWSLKRKNRSEEMTESQNPKGEDDDEKKKARLMRNRESAQLSRQRKKKYVEELEDKVKSMHSVINDLNSRISYMMAENASLRQQLGGGNLAQPGVYPPPGMHFPWIPGYALRPHGAPVPLVPIPKLKPQSPAPAKKPKKSENKKAKKVASISILGLIFVMMFFGAIFPAFTTRLGDEGTNFGKKAITNSHSVSNSTGESVFSNNSSETLPAMLYVPRNGKHVQIDGNLIIHSVLASERAMANKQKPVEEEKGETSLAVAGYFGPQPKNYGENSKSSLPDGPVPQWFREGMTGSVLSSGMCTEVFQFDVSSNISGGIVPATKTDNITNSVVNLTGKNLPRSHVRNKKKWSRRVMYNNAIPLPGKTLDNNNTNTNSFENSDGHKKPASKVVVSVLADPRDLAGDGDGVSPKSLSRVFVVVLLDGIKYVTYSCVLPFKSAAHHLVNY
ncbi:BZIP transcription factor [Rhynchospora pubera]|uniref:BZIP transcription factor n=1 Tax=Rhynchospora pubera TaxID=906938 RepID=A0AAV8E9A0_9POAL|nr:BZIP transcription factor [Rhynchospora pubera]